MYPYLLMAQPGAEPNPIATFLPLVLIFVVFYFFIIRPQRKKEDERKQMIEAVKKGDKVVTIGGVFGHVTQVDDTSLLVQVDTNTKLRLEKTAIARIDQKTWALQNLFALNHEAIEYQLNLDDKPG